MSQTNNGMCPLVPWKTERDNQLQSMWCPIAQSQNYNLMDVFTGGNDPRMNKMMGVEYYINTPGNYRPIPQLADNLAGPICMAGNCGPLQPAMRPTPAPTQPAKKTKEGYCGCGSRTVNQSGINMIPYR